MSSQPATPPGPAEQQVERHTARMARGSGLNLVGAVVQQAALLAVMTLLARSLGTVGVGRYSELWALLALLSLFSLSGFRAGLTRFVAVFLADEDAARVRGTIRLGMSITVLSALILALGLYTMAGEVAAYFHDPALVPGVQLIALALPAAAISDAALAATQGWRTQRAFAYIGRIFDPLTMLGLTGLAVAVGWGLRGALIAVVVAAWLTALLACLALLRLLRSVDKAQPIMEPRRIFSFSMISWLSALAATGLIWAGTLILGGMVDPGSVGVFNIASRLVGLAVFVMPPITGAFAPHMAHLYHRGEHQEAARAYGNATRWILFTSMPAFVVLVVFPEHLLRLFGQEFTQGATVTVILACGQLVAAAAGPCGIVLNMSGRVVLSLVDNVGVLVLNVVLAILLIPRMGIVGAAVAWSISLVAVNITKLLQARFIVGVAPVGARVVPTLLAAVPATLAGLATRELVPSALAALLVGGSVVVAIYLAAQLLLGMSREDLTMLRQGWHRVLQGAGLASRGSRGRG